MPTTPDDPMTSAACSTCRFWKSPEQRTDYRDAVHVNWIDGEADEDREARSARWRLLYGECSRPEFCPESDELSLDDPPPMVTRDGSEYMATLFTLGTFGCRAWEGQDA